MEDLESLQKYIRDLGLRVSTDGNKLLIRGNPKSLSMEHLGVIQQRKEELISYLAEKSGESVLNIAPLTFRQERHLQIMREEGSVQRYMIPIALMLEGPLDVELLVRSIDVLIARHESLRTRIIEVDSIPMQQIDEPKTGHLTVEVVGAGKGQEDAARSQLVDFLSESVDLHNGPLFKAKLLRLNGRKNILAICAHHLITDVESLTQFFIELWAAYREIGDGRLSRCEQRRFQFGDYATWLRSSAFDCHENFWTEKLRGAHQVRWPTDKQENLHPAFSARGASVAFRGDFSGDLQKLAQHLGTVPALVMLAAYAAVITHWCDQEDFVIPFITNGRTLPEHTEAMGWFAYPLFVRLRVGHEMAFAELTEYVAREFLLALDNADGGRLLLHSLPYLSQGTVFRWATALDYQDACAATGMSDLIVREFPIRPKPQKSFELRTSLVLLHLEMYREGVRGSIAYRADLFSEKRMLSLAQSMSCMFDKLVNNPRTRIRECAISCAALGEQC